MQSQKLLSKQLPLLDSRNQKQIHENLKLSNNRADQVNIQWVNNEKKTVEPIHTPIPPHATKLIQELLSKNVSIKNANQWENVGDAKVMYDPTEYNDGAGAYNYLRVQTLQGEVICNLLIYKVGDYKTECLQRNLVIQHNKIFSQAFFENEVIKITEEELVAIQLQSHNVADLPLIYEYQTKFDLKQTPVVPQGEMHFFTPGKNEIDGLHTFGAGPCLILLAKCQDLDGKTTQIGMAHIDNATEKDLDLFFTQIRTESTDSVEVSIISGIKETALKVQHAAKKFGAKIVFASADFNEKRNDAATIDKNGTVYYGTNPQLKQNVDVNLHSHPLHGIFANNESIHLASRASK